MHRKGKKMKNNFARTALASAAAVLISVSLMPAGVLASETTGISESTETLTLKEVESLGISVQTYCKDKPEYKDELSLTANGENSYFVSSFELDGTVHYSLRPNTYYFIQQYNKHASHNNNIYDSSNSIDFHKDEEGNLVRDEEQPDHLTIVVTCSGVPQLPTEKEIGDAFDKKLGVSCANDVHETKYYNYITNTSSLTNIKKMNSSKYFPYTYDLNVIFDTAPYIKQYSQDTNSEHTARKDEYYTLILAYNSETGKWENMFDAKLSFAALCSSTSSSSSSSSSASSTAGRNTIEKNDGKVKLSNNNPKTGDTVVISATPNDDESVVDTVTVTDRNNRAVTVTANADGTYSFTQPEGNTSIKVTYTNHRDLYRLYNPNTGEHFYTYNAAEKDNIISAGWVDEKKSWVSPAKGDPVYRLYNPNGKEHHYTTNAAERDMLVAAGWNDEGVAFCSDTKKRVKVYRLYNPNAVSNNHHYTASEAERDLLISLGWKDEGIGFYAKELIK